jgi:pathogenesis-related protein 1
MNKIYVLILLGLMLANTTTFAVEPAQFSGILDSHNQVRAKHNVQPLSWSNSLASYAQKWVDNLARTQNCEMIHRPNYNGGEFQQVHGENLFWASAIELATGQNQQQQFTPIEIVKAWAQEEDFYNYQTNQCQEGQDCGHYTQMVWHESQQVGCAIAVCADKSQIWACNYHPRGNYIGEKPY